MALEIVESGRRHLAVPVPARGTALTRILALRNSPGWFVSPPSLKEWRFSGVTEKEGQTLLYGPWAAARTLGSALELPAEQALALLARLGEALALLKERSVALFPIQTDAVLFCDDGAVLFLPPELMQELRGMRPFLLNRDTFEALRNPDRTGEDMVCFALGAMLYRVVTGAFPFDGDSPEELHEQMRKLEILAPRELSSGLSPEVSETLMAALGRSRTRIVTLDGLVGSIQAWQRDGVPKRLPPQPGEAAAREARRRASEKKFRRRVFWEKNWKTALIVAAAVIVGGIVAGSVLKGVLAPRVTRGFPPEKVVRTFYDSMNTLDEQTMAACVVGGAGREEISEVTNLYVISRVSMGYEGRSNIVSAAAWDREGRPPIPAPRTLYGVTDLVITPEQPVPRPVFLVSYEKWTPVPGGGEGQASGPRYRGNAIQDRVFLRKDRGDWVIYRIDSLRTTAIPMK